MTRGCLTQFCSYLFPFENDAILLNLYLRGIMEGSVKKDRAPLMYWVAVHHIAACAFGGTEPASDQPSRPLSRRVCVLWLKLHRAPIISSQPMQ
jgi:hypothetical protein